MLSPRALGLSVALMALSQSLASAACSSYSTRFGANLDGVCVCTASAPCDEISLDYQKLAADQVGIFQTSQAGDRLAYSTVPLNASAPASAIELTVDTSVKYQKITGFGGALTDSTALNVYKLRVGLQEKLLSAYYGEKGIQYTLGRVPIGSTDFSTSIYSYNPVEDDLEMKNFSIDIDRTTDTRKLEYIKRVLKYSSRPLTLFASSWAPPAWMTREKRVQNSHMIGEPGEPYWQALALYYSRFFDEYKKEGINFWAMTTQNEPSFQAGFLEWQQLRFNTTTERDFIKKDLGPLMKKNHPELKIIMLDDQKDLLPTWNAALVDPEAKQYVSGVGVHWYKNLEFVLDTLGNFKELSDFNAKYPEVFILATEACAGANPNGVGTGSGVKIQQPAVVWKRGEIYARDIINDLANYAVGWTDWNMVLDTKGGPSWVGNYVDAPILIDEVSGSEFYKQPMYYVMGHFSKFLVPGSTRISLAVSDETQFKKVDRVAFQTPSGQIVLVLSNRDTKAMDLKLNDKQGNRVASVTLPANAVQTVLFAAPGSAPAPVPSSSAPAPSSSAPAPSSSAPAPSSSAPAPSSSAPAPSSSAPAPSSSAPAPSTSAPAPTTNIPAPVPTTTAPGPSPVPSPTSPSTPCPLPTPTDPATPSPAPTTPRPAC